MRFGLLGSVAVWVDGRSIEIGPPKRRLLLAVLLLDLGRVVPVDRLVELLWDDEPPPAARRVVFAHISRLRRLLTAAGAGRYDVGLETAAPGYVLRADPDRVDAHRFQRLVERARATADAAERAELLRSALALWRSDALADVVGSAVRDRLCRQLTDLRLLATEERLDADLRCGRHRALLGELTALVEQHPLRERPVELLMLARYRSGLQAEALEAFQSLRTRLVGDLGIEPGPELRRLQEAILRNDPALDLTAGPGAVAAAPAQLPADIAGFTGRAGQLKQLGELLQSDGGVPIALITGCAGIGKTALAVHWGHRMRPNFPDGQLYVNLRGHAPTPALRPIEALAQLLPGLGVPVEDVPVGLEQATALYRSRLSDRRILVVLDNAEAADQVRPLLPGSACCLVVVTSRNRLSGLVARDGARRVNVDVFAPDEALALLADVLGPARVTGEAAAAKELAERCAYLPLALRIAAANILDAPRQRIAGYVARLAAESRLAELAVEGDEEAAVRVAIDLSYEKLPLGARRLFCQLGLLPGPDWTMETAAALAGLDLPAVHRLADRLVTAHLAEPRGPDRFASHDLLRHYARERADGDLTATERAGALRRLFDWYVASARAASLLLNPELVRLPAPTKTGGTEPAELAAAPDAMRWLDAERANLLAAVEAAAAHGPYDAAWTLADALRSYFVLNRRTVDWLAVAGWGLAAAEAGNDPMGQAAAHLSLAQAHHRGLGNLPVAIEHNLRARALAHQAGWHAGEATALGNLGNGYRAAGRLDEAVACYLEALGLEQRAGRVAGQGFALSNLAALLAESGRLTQAVHYFEQALALRRAANYRAGEARTLCFLADTLYELGQFGRARTLVEQAIALYRDVGEHVNEAAALGSLAKVRCASGHQEQALADVRTGLGILEGYPSRWIEATLLNVLAIVEHQRGRPATAIRHREYALRLAREVGNRYQQASSLIGLAQDARLLGRLDDAYAHAQAALELTREVGFRLLEGLALTVYAETELDAGHRQAGVEHARQALSIHRETGHRMGEEHIQGVLRALDQQEY
ncbi:AfsR/SARP family transcriptional regulator [Flindersiella endophytica]